MTSGNFKLMFFCIVRFTKKKSNTSEPFHIINYNIGDFDSFDLL